MFYKCSPKFLSARLVARKFLRKNAFLPGENQNFWENDIFDKFFEIFIVGLALPLLWLSLAKEEVVIMTIIGSLAVYCIVLSNTILMWLLSYCTLWCLHNKIVLSVFRSTTHVIHRTHSFLQAWKQANRKYHIHFLWNSFLWFSLTPLTPMSFPTIEGRIFHDKSNSV